MITLNLILIFLYTTIIVSYIWARFGFFKVTVQSRKSYMIFYDSAAMLHIATTYYLYIRGFITITDFSAIFGAAAYILSMYVFWWAIYTAKNLDFAFSPRIDQLIKKGPYAFARHPLYSSYALTWSVSTILFNNLILWITLLYMMAYYYLAAKSEEDAILTGDHSEEYRLYSQSAGMFLPRITKWKKLNLDQ